MSWEENVRKVVPYTPGEQPRQKDVIKLNTNECPYPPAPAVERRIAQLDADKMRLYPAFPEKTALAEELAAYYHISTEQIFIGVGSDDVLSMAFMTFFQSEKPIIFPDITYSFYDVWADVYRIPYETKALDEDFRIRPEDYRQPNGGVIFPNPNAPTGILLGLDEVEEIIAANRDVVVIVDEAYVDFGGVSALPLIEKYDNLLVVQTFSKSRGLAGARLGLSFGSEALIADLNRVKFSLNPYNINRLTLVAGTAALEDVAYFDKTRKSIISTRTETAARLRAMGFEVTDSRSNFLFARTPRMEGGALYRALKAEGILVRHFNAPRISDYLRITVGTPAQMGIFLDTVQRILEQADKQA
jgi:histidinol-phosphate aminotransferase